MNILIEVIGWTGSFALIAAFGLNSYQKITSDSFPFLLLNLLGSILLIIYSVYKDATANVFINVVWTIIAVPALIKLFRKKK